MIETVASKEGSSIEERIKQELTKNFPPKRQKIFLKLIGAALGSIPWVGGFLNAVLDFQADKHQAKNNQLYEAWFYEHNIKIKLLGEYLQKVLNRLDEFQETIDERLDSPEFSQLVRKSFRVWDNADTHEKRELIRHVLTNAGTHKLVPDDLIRLFLDWIDRYHEAHFAIIRTIYHRPGATRLEIWQELNGTQQKENSLEADLFKFLIRELSTGSVIRQNRETDYNGNFLKKKPSKVSKASAASRVMKSAFDDNERYELTELGKQFVHYTMSEVVPRINND